MATTREIINDYYQSSDISYKQQQKNIIEKIYLKNENFFELSSDRMHDLLVNDLRLDKYNTMNVTLSAMTHLYEFAVLRYPDLVPYNIFKDEHLSRTVLSADMTKNMLLVTDEVLEQVLEPITANREWIHAANILFYEGVASNWSDLLDLKWSDISTFFWTVNKTPVSRQTIELLRYIYENPVWFYKKMQHDVPVTKLSEDHLFGYLAVKDDSITEQQKRKNCSMFMRRNFILYYQGHKLEAQNLYYSGITNKIIQKYGQEFFIETILEIRSLYQLEKVIEAFGLNEDAGTLKKNLMPYAYKIKYRQ
ncbi:MAG: hypothetical protein ACRDBO_02580 [Lachnospiraceae bacterium]